MDEQPGQGPPLPHKHVSVFVSVRTSFGHAFNDQTCCGLIKQID
ncbi:unnamed protein product [Rhodiola kirilowii]